MLFKLLTPFTLVAVFVVRATSVFDFPNVIPRAEIPVGITVHEYNGTAAALGAAAAPKLETFGSLKEGSDCNGSPVCKYLVDEDNCIQAALVRDGKETQTETTMPARELVLSLVLCGLADSFFGDSIRR